jgi:hypothetical protein
MFHLTCPMMLLFVLLPLGLFAQSGDPIRVWPGKAPDEPAGIESKKAKAVTGSDGVIRIPYVDTPELFHFPAPPDKATGTCIIVCPGGGYGKLAWNKEGTEIATWLNTLGVEAVVLKYRAARSTPPRLAPEPSIRRLHCSSLNPVPGQGLFLAGKFMADRMTDHRQDKRKGYRLEHFHLRELIEQAGSTGQSCCWGKTVSFGKSSISSPILQAKIGEKVLSGDISEADITSRQGIFYHGLLVLGDFCCVQLTLRCHQKI